MLKGSTEDQHRNIGVKLLRSIMKMMLNGDIVEAKNIHITHNTIFLNKENKYLQCIIIFVVFTKTT